MNFMDEMANNHLVQAQERQKKDYDRVSKRRSLQQGHKIQLLLPTSNSGLLAKWQGPFEVKKKMGPVTCELYLPKHCKNHQEPPVSCQFAEVVGGQTGGITVVGKNCG